MYMQFSRLMLPSLLVTGFGMLASTGALAQSDQLEEVTVVGSRIRQPQDQALPVTVITSQQMEQRGYATVQQALLALPQNSGGGFDQQLNFGYTPSASAVNFRDMGVGRVLVLIDGRRMPAFPVGFNGTDSFVDISSIPASAVERIEILADGASAVYGSDAMSGVINVVLKKQVGTELAVRYGDTVHGGGAEKRVQFSTGAESDGSRALLFLEYYKREALWYSQRDMTRSDRLGGVNGAGPGVFSLYGYPGTFTDWTTFAYPSPACDTSGGSPGSGSGFCEFNRAQYRQVWPDSSSVKATAKFDQRLSDGLEWFSTMRIRHAMTRMQIEPASYDSIFDSGVIIPAAAPNNPVGLDGGFVRRLVEFGPQRYDYDVNEYSALTGLKGEIGGSYTWELGLQSARQRVRETAYGQVLNNRISDALLGNLDLNGDGIVDPAQDALDLFQSIPGDVVAQLSYQPQSVATSTLSSADFQFGGDWLGLPAGMAQFATVLEYVKEIYDDRRDAEIVSGNVVGLGGTSGHGERERAAAGVEISLPLLSKLKLNLAGRYDRYNDKSDVGGAFSPRLALEFRPGKSWLLRASGGLSFRAPDMPRMFGGDATGFSTLIDTQQCIADGGAGNGDASVASCITPVQDVYTVTHANIKLKEERGRNFSAGVRWQPGDDFSASVDLFHIRLEDVVTTPDLQYMLDQNALNGSFEDAIFRDCSAASNAGCLAAIDTQAQNVAYKKVTGLDVAADYALDVSGLGRFTIGLSGTYLLNVEMQESVYRPPVDVLRDGRLGESVRVKGGLQLGWQRGPWASNLFVNYIGPFTPLNTSYVNNIGSYTTVNLSMNYQLPWRGELQLGVNNLFDRKPPLNLQDGDASLTFYHQQFHDVDGARWYAGYRHAFGGG
ncbi:MAG: TonB-dependent receptor plug domain-containing protein [Steroidobacteraceae bacterium]